MVLHGLLLRRPILQYLVELFWVRAQSPGLKVANFLIRNINLKADDISVLEFTLGEGELRLQEHDHVRLDFLGRTTN